MSRRRQKPVRRGELPGDDAEADDLNTHQDGDRCHQEGIAADRQAVRQGDLAGESATVPIKPSRIRADPGTEQPARRVDEQEAQMAPAVAPGAQMRWPCRPSVQRHRHLGDAHSERGAFITISLANSMPVGLPPACAVGVAGEAAQAAVKIADGAEKEATEEASDGLPIQRFATASRPARYRPEAVAHDEIVARAQLLHERSIRRNRSCRRHRP